MKANAIIFTTFALFAGLVLGVLYRQQKSIDAIALSLKNNGPVLPSKQISQGSTSQEIKQPVLSNQQIEQLLLSASTTTSIIGRIIEFDIRSMKVESEIIDISNLKNATSTDNLPKVKKIYSITINDKTEFPNFKLSEFQKDQWIKVFSSQPIYYADSLKAEKIIPVLEAGQADASKTDQNMILKGKVIKIEQDRLFVFDDGDENGGKKENTIKIGKDTSFSKISMIPVDSDKRKFKQEKNDIELKTIRQEDSVIIFYKTNGNAEDAEIEAAEITVIPPLSLKKQ